MSYNIENMLDIHSQQIGTLQARVAKLEQDTRTKDTPASPPEKSESEPKCISSQRELDQLEIIRQLRDELNNLDQCSQTEKCKWRKMARELARDGFFPTGTIRAHTLARFIAMEKGEK
jgi:hypothetical protein